jgi:hypothetical protein
MNAHYTHQTGIQLYICGEMKMLIVEMAYIKEQTLCNNYQINSSFTVCKAFGCYAPKPKTKKTIFHRT